MEFKVESGAIGNLTNWGNKSPTLVNIFLDICKAHGNCKNHFDIDYDNITDNDLAVLTRCGFHFNWSGVYLMYRINW